MYDLRKTKCNQMLAMGVIPVADGFNEYYIPSQTNSSIKYHVTIKQGWYACECPDNSVNHNLCKHILLLKTFLAIQFKNKEQPKVAVSNPCPYCASLKLLKDGTRKTFFGKKQKWLCQTCGKRFVNNPLPKIKGNEDTIITAIDLYMKGVSYRGIADSIKQFYGLKVTHPTIMSWVNTFMGKINAYVDTMQPQVGDTWHADEQFIKAKGKEEYIWNVLDRDTRFLLASNESPTRRYTDARQTFQEAKSIAGKKATTVITDGAFSYDKAVRKEFATYSNPKPHRRYISLADRSHPNNNPIERFHNSFRQRDKVMRGFKGNQKQYAENFKTYYNFIRKHQGLGCTPAQKAGLLTKPEWKELLQKSMVMENGN